MAITFPPQLGQQFNAPQQAGPMAQGPGASAFEPLVQFAQSASPEERRALAERVVAQGNLVAPPVDLGTEEVAGGAKDIPQATAPEDPVSGWTKFIDALADPEGHSRFLLEAGTNIMGPRPEQVSGAAFAGQGLTTALDRLGQRRASASAARGQAALQGAQIAGIGQDIRESEAGIQSQQRQDTAIPSEIQLNLANAWKAYQEGASTNRPAAQVQLNERLTKAIMAIAPDVHNEATATLLAQQLVKPDMERSTFLKDYGALMAIMGAPGDVGAQGLALADAMGLEDTATLESIQQEQSAATQQAENQKIIDAGPDAVFDHIQQKSPDATYEQIQARVLELTGQRSSRPDPRDALSVPEISAERGVEPTLPRTPKPVTTNLPRPLRLPGVAGPQPFKPIQ
jgi:hypothetical protein